MEIKMLECNTCYGNGRLESYDEDYRECSEDCEVCQGIGEVPTISIDNEVYEIPLVKRT